MKIKKLFIIVFLFLAVGIGGLGAWLSPRYVVPIMMYHNVEQIDQPQPNWVSPANFEWHMTYLRNHGFHVISLDELVQAIKAGKKLSRKSIVITFDDGYENNYIHAFPVLKRYGFPATIFVPSDFVNKKGYLTSGQMREMKAFGVDIGSHSQHHVYLPEIPLQAQAVEIGQSKRELEEILGFEVKYFAYPSGGFSEEIKRMVQEAGYQGVCTTNRGYNKLNKDVFELKRVRFSDKDNRIDIFWMKFSGFYNLLRKPKSPY